MSSDVALRLVAVSKQYRLRHEERQITAAEQLLQRLRHPLRRDRVEVFDALSNVDLEVHRGEVLGLIGRNGAGKSTLLKVLSRITPPSAGRVDLFGRVGSLLEVGTGFHPELTGRENIFLNGAILGMSRQEIVRQFDQIVGFAGVERFLDTPVKRYSSGMYVRLAFAVAAHLQSEILLVDEVLAVGDAEFQRRCIGKMQDVATDGRTVLFVSHNLESVARLCERVAYLHDGHVRMVGAPALAIEAYIGSRRSLRQLPAEEGRPGSGQWRVAAAEPVSASFSTTEPKRFTVRLERRGSEELRVFVSAHIVDQQGRVVAQCDSRMTGTWCGAAQGSASYELVLRTPWLMPGDYELEVYVCNAGIVDACQPACSFEVRSDHPYDAPLDGENCRHNVTLPDFSIEALDEAPLPATT